MRTLLSAAAGGMARGTSAACHGAIDVSAAGFNHIVRPAGSAVVNALLTVVSNMATVFQESVTGRVFVAGHQVSGPKDSTLKLPKRLIPASVKDLFTHDGRGLSEKGFEFLRNLGTYGGGVLASFIYQMAIVSLSDTAGKNIAQGTADKFEEGAFSVPLAVTGALAILAGSRFYVFRKNMDLSDLSEEQRSTVIAAHYGITPQEFNAKSESEQEMMQANTKRDWLALAGAAALMPPIAFSMNLIGKFFPATVFTNSIFKETAVNLTKEAVRAAFYGGLRESLQEVFTGPKGGVADFTHAEAGWSAVKYAGISGAVNLGQSAAGQAIPSTDIWGGKFSVLTAQAAVNAIGESLNWADLTSDRTKKCVELAKKNLIEQHQAEGLPPPTPDQLRSVAEQVEFAFNVGIKDQSFTEALRNIGRRYGGSLLAREGVYAFSNMISTAMSKSMSALMGNNRSYNVLNSILTGIATTLTYIKFNASSQSMGALRAIRAENARNARGERRAASSFTSATITEIPDILDSQSSIDPGPSSSGENRMTQSFFIDRTDNSDYTPRMVQSLADLESAALTRRSDFRVISDFN